MAQWVKVPLAMPGNLSLIFRTHMVVGRTECFLRLPYRHQNACLCAHRNTLLPLVVERLLNNVCSSNVYTVEY